jgi:hypothetical protein
VYVYFRAWDQTSGTAGETLPLANNQGGTNALSSAYAKAHVLVRPVNDAPVIGSLAGPLDYIHDQAPVKVAPSATVTDVDNSTLYKLVLSFSEGASGSTRLAIGEGFTVDAQNQVFYGDVHIGKRTSSGIGDAPLAVYFNANGTLTVVQELARAITFQTVNGSPGSHKLKFVVQDSYPNGGTSSWFKTINVT